MGARVRRTERVAENLNRALATLLADDSRVMVLGEDIRDPYGGAFKVTRGLSTRFPDRVLNTPISEQGFLKQLESRWRYAGSLINVAAGEAYYVREALNVPDPVELLTRPMNIYS
jgi:hypothetical protein